MKKTALFLSLSLLVCGGYTGTAYAAEGRPSPPAQMAPDNTGRNVRDRGKTIFEHAGAEDISYTEEARV